MNLMQMIIYKRFIQYLNSIHLQNLISFIENQSSFVSIKLVKIK